jgi:uroporphyrin-III C-methyltransferase
MKMKNLHPISITGTGPGVPDLLTVRAFNAISSADIVLYDCLPAHYVLNLISKDAEVIYLCKNHEALEEELEKHSLNVIDHLEKFYNEGKKVVRLKAGDAFMFGGGGAEANLLNERKIPFEVIPGITAGAAAANLYGIKISEKHESDLVMYYIAWEIKDDFYQLKQIAKLLKMGATLVLYMADNTMKDIIQVLKNEGVSGSMPSVVIGMASLPDEDCVSGTIDTILAEITKKEMLMPFTYFIGEYVERTIGKREKVLENYVLAGEEIY